MQNNFFSEIEKKIGYCFKNKELLLRAFTHATYANEHKGVEDYERLEFLGDAVLGYIVGLYLYETFPQYKEGKLTKIRASVVDRRTISSVVAELDIIKYMRVGAGNAEENVATSIKANCDLFEAIVGAIVVDCNDSLYEAKKFILRYLIPKIGLGRDTDYKSQVWEMCAKKGQKAEIQLLDENHIGNKTQFVVALLIDDKKVAEGEGPNKSVASRQVCQKYLELIK